MLDKSRARMLKRQLPHDQSKSLDEPSKKRDQNAVKINALHWLRKGLRLHDNPSLCEALKGSDTVRIIYILDVKFAREAKVSLNVWRFLLQSLDDVDTNLRKLGSRLFVVRGQPADVLPKLFLEWDITKLTFEEACEPFGKERDAAIMMLARDAGVEVKAISSHTLFDQQAIIRRNGGSPPLTYKKFLSIVHNFGPPKLSAPTVDMNMFEKCTTPLSEEHDEWYGVPTMEELGLDLSQLHAEVWHGGETEALRRLDRHLERKAWIANYGKPTITTNSLCSNPTGVSPYLRFGCLSPRLFYHRLTELYKKVKSQKPPLSLHGQLLWREFFYTVAANNPNFDKMECNPVCLKIPWRTNVSDDLNKWIKGKTGFPWIDAIMAQMREEGWIHNLAQHSVACFLTRGDLWISWEEGMKTFEEYMLDADWGITAGTWMWLSCSAFFQKFLQCLCPVEVGKKVDPNGDFIRKYLPILKGYPIKFIHTPWSAPEEVQRAAKCIIGRDYPRPIVNHTEISSINFEKMQEVYQAILLNKSTQMKKALSLINQEATETPERAGQKLRP